MRTCTFTLPSPWRRARPARVCRSSTAGTRDRTGRFLVRERRRGRQREQRDPGAGPWLRRNAAAHGFTAHLTDVDGCLPELSGSVDVVVANPPRWGRCAGTGERFVTAERADPGRPRFVAGSLGPTNRTASISPDVGDPSGLVVLVVAHHPPAHLHPEGGRQAPQPAGVLRGHHVRGGELLGQPGRGVRDPADRGRGQHEQAGGAASTGRQRLLDVVPEKLHQRIPVILGSGREIERIGRYHAEYDSGADKPYCSPLFRDRSLYRAEA